VNSEYELVEQINSNFCLIKGLIEGLKAEVNEEIQLLCVIALGHLFQMGDDQK
jgi:hypothetical protein